MIIRCVVCGQPVQHEAESFCYSCGRRSELDDLLDTQAEREKQQEKSR
jgi:hypothetical protein